MKFGNIFFIIGFLSAIEVGAQAPTFYLQTLDGERFFLSKEIKKGKPILINFFATWCGPCRKELPLLDSLLVDYPNVSSYLIDISIPTSKLKESKENPEDVFIFLKVKDIQIPVLLDRNGIVYEKWGSPPLPTTAIINEHGEIIFFESGFKDTLINQLSKTLDPYKKNKESNINE